MHDKTLHDKIIDLITTAEADLEVSGWDQPNILFGISGTADDPYLSRAAEFTDHPCDALQKIHDDGGRPPEGALGMAMAFEGWIIRPLDELREHAPEVVQTMTALVRTRLEQAPETARQYGATLDEQVEKVLTLSHEGLQRRVPPSLAPEALRVETRSVLAVLMDGTVITVDRKRGDEPWSGVADQKAHEGGRIPDYMHRFLTDNMPAPQPYPNPFGRS